MVERFNRTLLDYLAKYVDSQQRNWDLHLQTALLAYRSAEHEATDFSPAYLNLGREVKLPVDLAFGSPNTTDLGPPIYALELRQRLQKSHAIVRKNLNLAADSMKTRYDIKKLPIHFLAGEEAWFYNPKRRRGISPKLQSDLESPIRIISPLSELVYRIQCKGSKKTRVIHVDRLAPFKPRPELSRSQSPKDGAM
ncbi:uncharacterized protein LOC129944228 [Eupeodes corollae]|uniref:uncharacterized protein LOC129944228 n=1 Tax=Eupeodes corollae TaxID=290404 RepID=UPI002491C96C|nr:uncharacterized protein LOC129944228 [Eupeodes corollae]